MSVPLVTGAPVALVDHARAERPGLDQVERSVLASIGHQTGLFDVMAGLPPSSSEQIADAAGLDERYVREWLCAMAVGQFVQHEPGNETYALSPERAACLTRAAGPDNLALIARFVPLSG